MFEDLRNRYEAIGGISPFAKITLEQAKKLEEHLNKIQDEIEFKMYLGLKHIEPFIEDAVKQMHEDGIKEAISIVFAPHFSTFSIKSYNGRAKEEAEKIGGPEITCIESWYKEPKFIQYWAEKVKKILLEMTEEERNHAVLIFSAHSLPEKIIKMGDPYPDQLHETARFNCRKMLDVENYEIGWQSAGNTPEPWLGPDVQDLTRNYLMKKGIKHLFMSSWICIRSFEVLYDNDFECKVVM